MLKIKDNVDLKELEKNAKNLQRELDCALKLLSEMYPPCEKDGFMDNHTDYCSLNCGVDEKVFKKCWLMYIDDISKDGINELVNILSDNKIKFHVLKSDKELKENQKYKEVINKAIKYIEENKQHEYRNGNFNEYYLELNEKEMTELLDILKEVEHD